MAPSPTIRRLLKETAELSSPTSNPNPAFVAAPVSDANLHEWHFTLLGPPAPSPYAGGLYHGRITLPPTYPLKPPNFRFLTPSGRFEVNREICLSISGFHEETWMPAWGVRTALTALRSFMAEQGSAGQVGGLEASVETRKRLAVESRRWRCEGCKSSNEDAMKEWWEVCRQAGVKFHEEDLGLESLPDGMTLEARDPNTATPMPPTGTGESDAHRGIGANTNTHDRTMQSARSANLEARTSPAPYPPVDGATHLQPSLPHSVPIVPTPTADAAQAAAEAILTPADLAPPPSGHQPTRTFNFHAPPVAAATAALNQQYPTSGQRARDRDQTLSIDRAIAGVFLALVLLVLKKIFYPAGNGLGGAGFDDFYLQRE